VLADLPGQHSQVVDQIGELLAALGDHRVQAVEITVQRPQAAEQLAEVLALALQALAGPDQEQTQIRLRVGIEAREDLVDVDVGRGVLDRHHPAVVDLAGLLRAGVELEEHVLKARARAQEDRGVLVDRQVLAVDAEGDHGATVLELDGLDLPDLDARDVDGLPLPGHNGLRRRELRLQLERLVLEDRESQALLLDDDVGRNQGDHDEDHDRDEVAQVLADRGHLAGS
jgi:hypothetical protein